MLKMMLNSIFSKICSTTKTKIWNILSTIYYENNFENKLWVQIFRQYSSVIVGMYSTYLNFYQTFSNKLNIFNY